MYRKTLLTFLLLCSALLIASGYSSSYFSAAKVVDGNTFTTGYWAPDHLLISEVYWHDAEENKDQKSEWIELYNPTNEAINLKGYWLTTSETAYEINANHWLAAHGYILISHDSSVWHDWGGPSFEKINLGGRPEKWLEDQDDRIALLDDSMNLLDAISYGTDDTYLSPPIAVPANGHSVERISLEHDTDTAADFTEKETPTPGY